MPVVRTGDGVSTTTFTLSQRHAAPVHRARGHQTMVCRLASCAALRGRARETCRGGRPPGGACRQKCWWKYAELWSPRQDPIICSPPAFGGLSGGRKTVLRLILNQNRVNQWSNVSTRDSGQL